MLSAPQLWLCPLRERYEVATEALLQCGCFASGFQFLARELPDCLQHPEAWLAVIVIPLPEQALLDQRVETVEDVEFQLTVGIEDRLGCLDSTAADENAQTNKERSLILGQEAVAPLDRLAQCSLAFRLVARSAREELQPTIETSEQRRWLQDAHPGRSQLDRKRQTVETGADFGDGGGVLVRDPKIGGDRPRALDEQRHRLVAGKRIRRRQPIQVRYC